MMEPNRADEIRNLVMFSESIPKAARNVLAALFSLTGWIPGCLDGITPRKIVDMIFQFSRSEVTEDEVRGRLRTLASAGLVAGSFRDGLFVFHPSPERREKLVDKPTPLFDFAEKIDRNATESCVESDCEIHGEIHGSFHNREIVEKTASHITRERVGAGAGSLADFKHNITKHNHSQNECAIVETVGIAAESRPSVAANPPPDESGTHAFDASESRKIIDFSRKDVTALREQVAWRLREAIRESKPIRPEVIDRITAGIALGLPRFSLRDVDRIVADAEAQVRLYHDPFAGSRKGRRWRWQTVNLRFGDLWTLSGGVWPGVTSAGVEPLPSPPAELRGQSRDTAATCTPSIDELRERTCGLDWVDVAALDFNGIADLLRCRLNVDRVSARAKAIGLKDACRTLHRMEVCHSSET